MLTFTCAGSAAWVNIHRTVLSLPARPDAARDLTLARLLRFDRIFAGVSAAVAFPFVLPLPPPRLASRCRAMPVHLLGEPGFERECSPGPVGFDSSQLPPR